MERPSTYLPAGPTSTQAERPPSDGQRAEKVRAPRERCGQPTSQASHALARPTDRKLEHAPSATVPHRCGPLRTPRRTGWLPTRTNRWATTLPARAPRLSLSLTESTNRRPATQALRRGFAAALQRGGLGPATSSSQRSRGSPHYSPSAGPARPRPDQAAQQRLPSTSSPRGSFAPRAPHLGRRAAGPAAQCASSQPTRAKHSSRPAPLLRPAQARGPRAPSPFSLGLQRAQLGYWSTSRPERCAN